MMYCNLLIVFFYFFIYYYYYYYYLLSCVCIVINEFNCHKHLSSRRIKSNLSGSALKFYKREFSFFKKITDISGTIR